MTSRLSKVVPESCMVILLGVLLGLILHYSNFKSVADIPFFNSRIFFLFMLPPIVLDAGYFLHTRAFFDNMGTILLYAVVGTIFNTFTVGITLYVTTDLGIPLLQMLLFSCLIAAVDPVAVLAVFEEVHVNEVLYILVFGESLLNDAVTVVLYRLFEALATQATMEIGEVFIGIAAFFVVSIGGVLIGLLWAYLTAYFSKFTDHVRVLEPIFIVSMCYMSYLTAELFHFSGIISIVTCAIVMKPYVEANISHKSRIPLKYFLKMASTLSETVIFMMLGVVLFERELEFHASFTMVTLFLIFIYRAVGVVILSWLANTLRLNKLNKVDQFIMAYGGLRGAVSFSLAIVLNESIEKKKILETTTICVVFVTVFFQGITIKPLVNLLRVKRAVKRKEVMLGEVNDKLLDHLLGGIQDVIKHRGRYYWMNLYQYIDLKYMRPIFMREMTDQKVIDETVLMVYRKISSREHASPDMKRDIPDEDEFGDVVRDPRRSIGGGLANEDSEKYKVLMQHAQLSMALGSQIKGTRRFSKNNIVDETDICDKALRVRRHSRQMPHVPRSVISRQVSRQSPSNGASETDGPPPPRCRHHKHNRNHKHRKHKKVTKKLSDIPESPTSNDATSDSPPLGKSPEDRNLLPKISDFGSCSPQLAMKFSRSSEPAVSSDPESPMMADTVM